jgi:hypothetical protein
MGIYEADNRSKMEGRSKRAFDPWQALRGDPAEAKEAVGVEGGDP